MHFGVDFLIILQQVFVTLPVKVELSYDCEREEQNGPDYDNQRNNIVYAHPMLR
jgi:hypothetical protein